MPAKKSAPKPETKQPIDSDGIKVSTGTGFDERSVTVRRVVAIDGHKPAEQDYKMIFTRWKTAAKVTTEIQLSAWAAQALVDAFCLEGMPQSKAKP